MTVSVHIKRAYEASADSDGFRVLVDRLWPRGLSKATLKYDRWCKDLAPSSELRKWFGHQTDRWEDFRRDYVTELKSEQAQALMGEILDEAQGRPITLVYGARDPEHNQAVVLAELLAARARHRPRSPSHTRASNRSSASAARTRRRSRRLRPSSREWR